MSEKLRFRRLPGHYAIVRLPPDSVIPAWAIKSDFISITRTSDELSIVCPAEDLPAEVQSLLRWICLKLEGQFPFSQTGVLLSFIRPLSENEISIFAISTFDTDYVLIMEGHEELALKILREWGHVLNK